MEVERGLPAPVVGRIETLASIPATVQLMDLCDALAVRAVLWEVCMRRAALRFSVMAIWFLALTLVWITATGQATFPVLQTLQFGDEIFGLSFSPDGRYLAVCMREDEDPVLIELSTWETRTLFPAMYGRDLAFSPDGSLLAVSMGDDAKIVETATWGVVKTLVGNEGWLFGLAFSPDGCTLAAGYYEESIKLWDLATGQELRTLVGHYNPVTAVAFSPDGMTLASAGGDTVILWDAHAGTVSRRLEGSGSPWSLSFSPDGKLLAVPTWNGVELWNVASGFRESSVGRAHAMASVFSPKGTFLAVGTRPESTGNPGVVELYALPSGRQIASLEADPAYVWRIAVSKDGTHLASGGHTGRVVVWDISALSSSSCSGFQISKVDWNKGCITLTNKTTTLLDLSGWKIADEEGSYTFPATVLVDPGKAYTLCPNVYNPFKSAMKLLLDDDDQSVSLYAPEICGGAEADAEERW